MLKAAKQTLITQILTWHFIDAPSAILSGWSDFLKFSIDFFSITALIKTIFKPWKRVAQEYSGGIGNLSENAQVFILNTFSRIIGTFIRLFLIVVGIIATFLIFIGGLFLFLIWFFIPVIIVGGLIFSLAILF